MKFNFLMIFLASTLIGGALADDGNGSGYEFEINQNDTGTDTGDTGLPIEQVELAVASPQKIEPANTYRYPLVTYLKSENEADLEFCENATNNGKLAEIGFSGSVMHHIIYEANPANGDTVNLNLVNFNVIEQLISIPMLEKIIESAQLEMKRLNYAKQELKILSTHCPYDFRGAEKALTESFVYTGEEYKALVDAAETRVVNIQYEALGMPR